MTAIVIFTGFVAFLFWLSWFLGKRSSSSDGFFVAGGQIHWFVNGIALTGGYLSAASFLGICGMIAFKGFDGYLYSIGFLSGWVVALFVVAEPLRRLGKYTFADALETRFQSRMIHLAAGISTLIICMCYLVPQMVGAGVLIEPLLGIPHHWGVVLVGAVVIVVVASAGMSSTTYVQFLKAGMLITFSLVLVFAVLWRGLYSPPELVNIRGESIEGDFFHVLPIDADRSWGENLDGTPYDFVATVKEDTQGPDADQQVWVLLETAPQDYPEEGYIPDRLLSWWRKEMRGDGSVALRRAQDITRATSGAVSVNGLPVSPENVLISMGRISTFGTRTGYDGQPGPIGPLKMLAVFADPGTEVELPSTASIRYQDKEVSLYYHAPVPGNVLMRPGVNFAIEKGNLWGRLNFISLMVALFFGTAALPHVLIRYYTVRDSTAARRSTIVAISAIGLFYVLTLYLGLGAIVNGVLNPVSDNMSAPLLANSFGNVLFAIITALAFATVLGTVSGLIVAASGAVANDLMDKFFKRSMDEKAKVFAAKATAVIVGIISVVLGILFRGVNVGFLVGLAFSVAASANFPSIIMVLFWKKTTAAGIVASILVGSFTSIGIIFLGPDMFELYGQQRSAAWIPLGQPAIVSMPLSFITLVVFSLIQKRSVLDAKQ
jgi:cation/acetate symporter